MSAKTTLYLAKVSVTTDGENKIYYDKVKFKQYLSISAFLQKVEGKLQPKEVNYTYENTENKQSHISKTKRRKMYTHMTTTTNSNSKITGINNH